MCDSRSFLPGFGLCRYAIIREGNARKEIVRFILECDRAAPPGRACRERTSPASALKPQRLRPFIPLTGITGGAPFFFTRIARILAGSVLLAFRPTMWMSSGPS